MDRWNLERFVQAQNEHGTYRRALEEIAGGRKLSHWMWFVFPQLAGLGSSPIAQHFALSGLDEARADLAHPTLGARLRECVACLVGLDERDATVIFGEVDAMKLRSSLTLFAQAAAHEPSFGDALRLFFSGPDAQTLRLLGSS